MARRTQSSFKKSNENFYNGDDMENDRFQSMYQATMCKTAKSISRPYTANVSPPKRGQQNTFDSRNHSQTKKPHTFATPINQHRKFGEYGPADQDGGLVTDFSGKRRQDGKHSMTATKSLNHNPFVDLPTGYEGSRKTRCTDRFVRYPYPKLYSNYKQNYSKKLKDARVQSHKQAFNLEKETKIINPHRMEKSTTNADTFKKFVIKKQQEKKARLPKEQPPNTNQSSYQAAFPNWKNGQDDIFHEKEPQYPVYSLPFNGESSYKQSFTDKQLRELKRQHELLSKSQGGSHIKMNSYQPQPFAFETTHSKTFRDFKVHGQKPYSVTQMQVKPEAVQTRALPIHFDTTNRNEYKNHQIQQSKVDRISYP